MRNETESTPVITAAIMAFSQEARAMPSIKQALRNGRGRGIQALRKEDAGEA